MIAALLLAALSPLSCSLPSEFFAATNGTEAVLDVAVPSECVYDAASPTGKVLRVTPGVAAFYYAFVSGYLERELLFGSAHGTLGGIGLTKAQAFAAMKFDTLNVADGNVAWLNDENRRRVDGLGRFTEGTLTHDIVSSWIDMRMGRWAISEAQGYIAPRYFERDDSARSIDFPTLTYLEPSDILTIVDSNTLARTWVTWACLDFNRFSPFGKSASPILGGLRSMMSVDCEMDNRPGSPATNFGVPGGISGIRVGETFTNVVEKIAPGCFANLTNETRRLDYRRLVAISRLLSLDDRQIWPGAFGDISIDTNFDTVYTNYLDVTISQECSVIVTNATAMGLEYNPNTRQIETTAEVSAGDLVVLTNSTTAVTNAATLSYAIAAANCDEGRQSLGNSVGGIDFACVVSAAQLKDAAPVSGIVYRFAAYFNAAEFDDSVRFDMWHGSSPLPIDPDFTSRPGLEFFHQTNVLLRVSRWRSRNHCWTLDPRLIGEEARIPTTSTHDATVFVPVGGGFTKEYDSYYPKWLYSSGSLVSGLTLYFCGNLITLWDDQTVSPIYDDSIGPDLTPRSNAYYVHRPHANLSYAGFFHTLWNDVAGALSMVGEKFAAMAGTRPGEILEPGQSAASSIAATLSAQHWFAASSSAVLDVEPNEAYFDGDSFYEISSSSTTRVDGVTIWLTATPPANVTNRIGRAVSVGANLGYLTGIEAGFKNLVPASD